MKKKHALLILSFGAFAACSPDLPDVEFTEIPVASLPDDVSELVKGSRAGFEPAEVIKKVREGRVYYDIEGSLPDGTEIEFDVLMTTEGPQIVEIQRDVVLASIPEPVRQLATSSESNPVRIIESIQTDGAIIFEFFTKGNPQDPAYEIKWDGSDASLLTERWQH